MWEEELGLPMTDDYWTLFRYILRQEKSNSPRDKLTVQKRKEILSREKAVALVNAGDIRKKIEKSITLLKKNCSNGNRPPGPGEGLQATTNDWPEKFGRTVPSIKEEEPSELNALRKQLDLTDEQLVADQIENIRCQPTKTNQEYLNEADDAREALFKKWGSVSYRGIGATLGAAIGAILGTLVLPVAGSYTGAVLGGGFGALFGCVVFGILVNHLIVDLLVPLSNARSQARSIAELRKRKNSKESPSLVPFMAPKMVRSHPRAQEQTQIIPGHMLQQIIIRHRNNCPKDKSTLEIRDNLFNELKRISGDEQPIPGLFDIIESTLFKEDAKAFAKAHLHNKGFSKKQLQEMVKESFQIDDTPEPLKNRMRKIYLDTLEMYTNTKTRKAAPLEGNHPQVALSKGSTWKKQSVTAKFNCP
jgi:hypothetical protein